MWCVLTGVGYDGVTNPSELADYIGITRPATSRLLRTMETRGLLERSYGGNDGRMIEVRLSARGAEVLALARKGVAILMISSELPEVVGMSDRVYVMREGSIAGELHGRDISQENIMTLATGVNDTHHQAVQS